MNRLFFIMGLLFILIIPQAWGSTSQYPNPYRQTMWNNLTDTIHTWGQSPRQAALTKMRLHNARARARIRSINHARHKAWLQGH
jgi:predicted PurR-regulated permease PerM